MSGLINSEDMLKSEIDELKESLKITVEALKFYANEDNYLKESGSYDVYKHTGYTSRKVLEDNGDIARIALKEINKD